MHRQETSCTVSGVDNDDAPETFAGRLRAARTVAGLTQEEVARRADLTLRQYVGLERGEGEPRGRNLVQCVPCWDVRARSLKIVHYVPCWNVRSGGGQCGLSKLPHWLHFDRGVFKLSHRAHLTSPAAGAAR